jgi:hypothetical protein
LCCDLAQNDIVALQCGENQRRPALRLAEV